MKRESYSIDIETIQDSVHSIISELLPGGVEGHLKDTPQRVAKMYKELTTGYFDPEFKFTVFPRGKNDEMIIESGIPLFSLCSHHLVPFFGVAHVAYVPKKVIGGLSKLARTVEHFSRRFQVQEDLTREIADYLQHKLHPMGTAVILECRHMCMEMRGVGKPGSITTTSSLLGVFRKSAVRMEFLSLIRRNGRETAL